MAEIKNASTTDIERLVAYGEQFWHLTKYYKDVGIDYNLDTVTTITKHLVKNGIVLYAEEDGEVVGLMLVFVSPFPMNADYLQATEWVFYVDESHRRTGLGQDLIQEAEAQLLERGVTLFSMISLSNVTPEAAERLYENLGYEHTETAFTKVL